MDNESIIRHTHQWVETVVVGLNFCPFARREVESGAVRYVVCATADDDKVLQALINECERLRDNDDIETTLFIMPDGFDDFNHYLNMLDVANRLLQMEGYEGELQLASFHPHYCFEGEDAHAASNYTNRSPYPMMHLIREASLERAVAAHPEPELIPERNIALANEKGVHYMQILLSNSKK